MVTNNTSVPYLVCRKGNNPVHLDPHSAILLTVGAQHKEMKLKVLNMWCGKDNNLEVKFTISNNGAAIAANAQDRSQQR